MSTALHTLAAKLDDSRSSLASYARVIADLGFEVSPALRAEVVAAVALHRQLAAELDALVSGERKVAANAG